ncbi:CHAT domain-containing protein [Chitinophaga lutea]|uniref:CHAT domain-containing protein n=1 Tax=Chitinophaga lutea TaxID=2488634 RepID=UPI001315A369|nr:CHAT domain-containing protein [Chitinophaga lutea]
MEDVHSVSSNIIAFPSDRKEATPGEAGTGDNSIPTDDSNSFSFNPAPEISTGETSAARYRIPASVPAQDSSDEHKTSAGKEALPASLTARLATLRSNNNLEEWIFVYLDYITEQPVQRLKLLMDLPAKAWRQPANADERTAWLDMLTYQGYYQMYAGNILPSIAAYENAYRFYYAAPNPETDVLEYILKPLGNNYTRLGDYERATFIQTKGLDMARQHKDAKQVAGMCNNLAVSCVMQEQYAKALEYGREGLRHAPEGSGIAGLLHATIADVYLKSNRPDSAALNAATCIWLLNKSAALKEENAAYWLASAHEMAGDIALAQLRLREAQQSFNAALQRLDKYYPGARKRERARLLGKCGRVALLRQQPAPQYGEAIRLLVPVNSNGWPADSVLYGEYTLADALEGRADALVQAGRLEDALAGYQLIFRVEQLLRREFFSRATRLLHQRQFHDLAEKAMHTAFILWERTGDQTHAATMLQIMEKSKAQVLLEEQLLNQQISRLQMNDSLLGKQRQLQQAIAYYDREAALSGQKNAARNALAYELSQVQLQIKKKYPDYFEPVTTDWHIRDLPAGLTVKHFFTGKHHIYIMDLDAGGIKTIRRLANAQQLQASVQHFVSTYFHNGPQAMQNNPRQFYDDAHRIYRWLWNDTAIAGKYLLIPDGWLGYLPFDALPTNAAYQQDVGRWPFLLKRASTGLAYSLETWFRQQQQHDNAPRRMTGFFMSGDGLPAVDKEYDLLRGQVKGKYFRNGEATLAAFREQLAQASLLHLSTHAYLQGEQQLPAIQLADGPFFLFELYTRKFRPGLIMLSACRTGQGMMAEGEGIISLAREFAASGASGIVAGLWNVHDAAGAQLTGDFYNALLRQQDPMTALHTAKTAWVDNSQLSRQLKLPYYWAALTYVGHHHAFVIEKNGKRNGGWWLAGGLLISISVFIVLFRKRKHRRGTNPV